MPLSISIVLKKSDWTFYDGDIISGVVVIDSKSEEKHDGIQISLEGLLNINLSSKNAGLLDSFVQTSKPLVLTSYAKEIVKPGKLSAGRTQLPFEVPLKAKTNRTLYETFHGVHIFILYTLKCEVKRSLLAKHNKKHLFEPGDGPKAKFTRKEFEIKPESLQNVRERSRVPQFLVQGYLDSTDLILSKPITGELCVVECERGISSIELQLVRIETCGSTEINTKEVSEIQNIQLCSGDIPRGVNIPVYMMLPRLFTCTTTIAPTFKIEFELNIIIIFDNDHLVMESFPIHLTRQ
ncbi:Down syndrome critical region protein 3 [Armadillidium vulgare]|nr:Down syndrome critical region protein 3 [Armadillidium vulgare]